MPPKIQSSSLLQSRWIRASTLSGNASVTTRTTTRMRHDMAEATKARLSTVSSFPLKTQILSNHHPARNFSAPAAASHYHVVGVDDNQPQGDLFDNLHDDTSNKSYSPCQDWIGKTGRIKRTFGAQANADAMLLCGGAALAAHASFDPQYQRAAQWIHNHAVGPAVLSPVLTSGLIHTLTEAAFPHSVPLAQSMQQVRPLIVGVSVYATITVEHVTHRMRHHEEHDNNNNNNEHAKHAAPYAQQGGFQIDLRAVVSRVRDDVVISQGQVSIWLADLQHQHHSQDDYVI